MSSYQDKVQIVLPSFEYYPKDALIQQNHSLTQVETIWAAFQTNTQLTQTSLQERLDKVNSRIQNATSKIESVKGRRTAMKIVCPDRLDKTEDYESFSYNLCDLQTTLGEISQIHQKVTNQWLEPIEDPGTQRGAEPKYSKKELKSTINFLFRGNRKIPTFDYINKPDKGFQYDELKNPRSKKNLGRVKFLDSLMLFDSPKNVFTRGRDQRELYAAGKKVRKEVKTKKKIVETQQDLEQSLIMGKSFMSYTPNIDTDGIKYVPTTKAFVEMEDDDDDDFGLAGVVDVDFGEIDIGLGKDVSVCESAFGGSGFTQGNTTVTDDQSVF